MAGKLTGCTHTLHSSAQGTRNIGNESVKLGRKKPDQRTEHFIHAPCHRGAWEALYSSPAKSKEEQ